MKVKTSLALIIFILVFFSCKKQTQPAEIKNKEPKYCIETNTLLGKQYLDDKFIAAIDAISTSSKEIENLSEMILIKGGEFEMGGDMPEVAKDMPETALPQGDEFPKHRVQVSDFYMDEHEVTVGQFLEFVKTTNYKTVAEYDIDWEEIKKQMPPGTPKPNEDMLKAGALVFHLVDKKVKKDNLANWWTLVKGANWKNYDGKSRDLKEFLDFPVTQVSWYDAMAYAKWVNKRLPTEAEYEYAMRGGKESNMYPWGNEKLIDSSKKGNFLQGEFPYSNTGVDGFKGLAPVKSFPPNAYGLYDIAGNVWEWTNDWYDPLYYSNLKAHGAITNNPKGPEKSLEIFNNQAINKVVRGGSFLCHDDWCSGYRNSRRMRLSPDTGMQHLGFRLVRTK